MGYKAIVALIGLVFAPLAGWGQPIPGTAVPGVVQLGESFVRAVNDTSSVSHQKAVAEIFSEATIASRGMQGLLDLLSRLNADMAPLEYHHSEVVGKALHVYARTRDAKTWRDFQFYLQTEPPYKIDQLVFVAEVAEPVYLPNGDITAPETIEWLNGYIDKLIRDNDLSAGVLIAIGEEPIFERYFGFADSARTHPVTAETQFNLGSGNKVFTALSVMMLTEEGRLRLDDPLIKYFPDFPDSTFATQAKIHNLLSHTSGLGDYWDSEYEQHWHEYTELAEILPKIYTDGTDFAPGTAFQYSNSGYILAGLIVERASGQDYFDFVRERIYNRLGMASSDSYLRDGSVPGLAQPLRRCDSVWCVAELGLRGTSAGGGYSTPRDMLKFMRGLKAGALVGPASLRDMTTPKNTGLSDSYPYGYGFIIQQTRGGVVSYGHGGIAPGVNFNIQHFPGQDITFVIFSNQDNGAYDDLRKNIEKLITGAR